MITRTSSSRLADLSASSSRRTMPPRSAFSLSGRLSVIVATAPAFVYFTTSVATPHHLPIGKHVSNTALPIGKASIP
jgi:hypothetical protein